MAEFIHAHFEAILIIGGAILLFFGDSIWRFLNRGPQERAALEKELRESRANTVELGRLRLRMEHAIEQINNLQRLQSKSSESELGFRVHQQVECVRDVALSLREHYVHASADEVRGCNKLLTEVARLRDILLQGGAPKPPVPHYKEIMNTPALYEAASPALSRALREYPDIILDVPHLQKEYSRLYGNLDVAAFKIFS